MLRFGYHTNGFAYHSLDDALDVIAECGYDGVAIAVGRHHLNPERTAPAEKARLRDKLRELHLHAVIETGTSYALDSWNRHDPSLISPLGRERRIEHTMLAIDTAAGIGADTVTVLSGRLSAGTPADEAFEWLVDGCKLLCEYAEMHGIQLALEPFPGMYIERLNQFDLLYDAVNHGSFRMTLDLGTVHCVERYAIASILHRFGARIATVHIGDVKGSVPEHLPVGQGELPLEEILQMFEEFGFDGMISVETENHSHTAPVVAQQSIRILRDFAPRQMAIVDVREGAPLEF